MSNELAIALMAGVFGVIGGFLAYFTSILLEERKNTIAFNMKIFEIYDKIKK